MEQQYVPRPEFDRFCKEQNGNLRDIKTGMRDMDTKLDILVAEGQKYLQVEMYRQDQRDLAEVLDKLRGRPGWAISVMITLMSSVIVGLLVLVLTTAI